MADYAVKQLLMAELEYSLRDTLTITEMEKLRSELLRILTGYEVEKATSVIDAVAGSRDFMQMFTDAKLVEGRSPNTLRRYEYILNQFFNVENVTARETTVYHIRDYFMKRKRKGIADSTIAGERDILITFFGWLANEGLILRNPCANVGTIKVEKKVRKAFSPVEIQKIIDACETKRDRALVLFLLNTGVRVSELCSAEYSQLDFSKNDCVVYGKENKQRYVYYDDVTKWALTEYIEESGNSLEQQVFLKEDGEPLKPGDVRKLLKEIEERIGVENIHPHRFRRTFATQIINRGMPIQEVKALLGHEKIDTTLKYVYQTKERTRNAYFQYK